MPMLCAAERCELDMGKACMHDVERCHENYSSNKNS